MVEWIVKWRSFGGMKNSKKKKKVCRRRVFAEFRNSPGKEEGEEN